MDINVINTNLEYQIDQEVLEHISQNNLNFIYKNEVISYKDLYSKFLNKEKIILKELKLSDEKDSYLLINIYDRKLFYFFKKLITLEIINSPKEKID